LCRDRRPLEPERIALWQYPYSHSAGAVGCHEYFLWHAPKRDTVSGVSVDSCVKGHRKVCRSRLPEAVLLGVGQRRRRWPRREGRGYGG